MKYIKSFNESWDHTVNGSEKKDLEWVHKFILSLVGDTDLYDLDCSFIETKDGECLSCKGGSYEVQIFDNGQDNDFFLLRILKDGVIIQDFKKNDEVDGYSSDEIPSEYISIIIPRYFQK